MREASQILGDLTRNDPDPKEDCHYSKHVDQAVCLYLVINLHQSPSKLQSSGWVYKHQLYFNNGLYPDAYEIIDLVGRVGEGIKMYTMYCKIIVF